MNGHNTLKLADFGQYVTRPEYDNYNFAGPAHPQWGGPIMSLKDMKRTDCYQKYDVFVMGYPMLFLACVKDLVTYGSEQTIRRIHNKIPIEIPKEIPWGHIINAVWDYNTDTRLDAATVLLQLCELECKI